MKQLKKNNTDWKELRYKIGIKNFGLHTIPNSYWYFKIKEQINVLTILSNNFPFLNQAKERFISSVLEKKANVSTVSQPLTADDLSEFYRSFLDENREKHLQYNIEWHKKNIRLVVPGVKAFVSRLLKRLS